MVLASASILLLNTFKHLASQQTETVGPVFITVLFFGILLILCISEGSQGTTTNPPQQRSGVRALKELCEVSTKVYFSWFCIVQMSSKRTVCNPFVISLQFHLIRSICVFWTFTLSNVSYKQEFLNLSKANKFGRPCIETFGRTVKQLCGLVVSSSHDFFFSTIKHSYYFWHVTKPSQLGWQRLCAFFGVSQWPLS